MHVTSLHCYPIKGCRGHDLDAADVELLGIRDDRRLMVVDASDRFISQREVAALATVEPKRTGLRLELLAGNATFATDIQLDGAPRAVQIWNDRVTAVDQGDAAAEWFADVIGQRCRLVAFGERSRRAINPYFTPRHDAQTSFTDGFPLLGVLEESLADLNSRLDAPVPMARFRPSIVVRGAPAWSEDGWRGMTIGVLEVDGVKPCARCVVTTTDQQTGARHPEQEPLRTLSSFRVQRPFGTIFGMNIVPRTAGRIAVGDAVVAL